MQVLRECKEFLFLGAPLAATFFLELWVHAQTLFFVGQLGKLELAGAALGVTWTNVSGFSVIVGLLNAEHTLCSQSFGAKKYHMVGIYFQRSMVVCFIAIIPVIITWVFLDKIFVLLKQEPETATLARTYAMYLIPCLFFYTVIEASKRYLQSQAIVGPLFWITFITAIVAPGMSYLFIFVLKFGFVGAPIAVCVTDLFSLVLLLSWILCRGLHVKTWPGFTTEAFKDIGSYLQLAVGGLLMICAEWWAYEILNLVSGTVNQVVLDTQSALYTTLNLAFMVPLGFAVAAGTVVGNSLGAGNPGQAKKAAKISILMTLPVNILFAGSLLAASQVWGNLFTKDHQVLESIKDTILFTVLAVLTDGAQCVASGIIRGTGQLKTGGVINIIAFYAIAIPVGSVCAIKLGMGGMGLWIGICSGSFFQAVSLYIVLILSDWEKLSKEAQELVGDGELIVNEDADRSVDKLPLIGSLDTDNGEASDFTENSNFEYGGKNGKGKN